MDVILLEKSKLLGNVGDVVTVKRGYARNYLIPRQKAVYATNYNLQRFAEEKKIFEQQERNNHQRALERKAQLDALGELTIPVKVGKSGKLFGSVGVRDVLTALDQAGFPAIKSEILIPAGSIRSIGAYQVEISLHTDIQTVVAINIVKDESELE